MHDSVLHNLTNHITKTTCKVVSLLKKIDTIFDIQGGILYV
jgi:hypothetical protein